MSKPTRYPTKRFDIHLYDDVQVNKDPTQQVTREALRLVGPEQLKVLTKAPNEPADPGAYAQSEHLSLNVSGYKEQMMRRIVAAHRLRGPAQQAMLNSIQRMLSREPKTP